MDTKTKHIHNLIRGGANVDDLPNFSDMVRHDSKYTRVRSALGAHPIVLTTPQFPQDITGMKPHLDLARDQSSRHGVFTAYVLDELGNQREFVIKNSTLEVALGEVAMGH